VFFKRVIKAFEGDSTVWATDPLAVWVELYPIAELLKGLIDHEHFESQTSWIRYKVRFRNVPQRPQEGTSATLTDMVHYLYCTKHHMRKPSVMKVVRQTMPTWSADKQSRLVITSILWYWKNIRSFQTEQSYIQKWLSWFRCKPWSIFIFRLEIKRDPSLAIDGLEETVETPLGHRWYITKVVENRQNYRHPYSDYLSTFELGIAILYHKTMLLFIG